MKEITEILPGALYTHQETMGFLRIGWDAMSGILSRHELAFSYVGRRRRFLGQDILDYLSGQRPSGEEKGASVGVKKKRSRSQATTATSEAIARLKALGVME